MRTRTQISLDLVLNKLKPSHLSMHQNTRFVCKMFGSSQDTGKPLFLLFFV